jgi:ergothioneine biosynthesis protein EgtB
MPAAGAASEVPTGRIPEDGVATVLSAEPDASLAQRYAAVRAFTERLCEPLATEDYVVQSMEDVSPTKWHLAHTTWFFETFVLRPHLPGYAEHHPQYAYLFNSYYVQAGERHCRAQRGYISRPTVAEVYAYRRHVDEAMAALLSRAAEDEPAVAAVVEVGLNHEQQHQELMLTDIKHVFSVNPLRPAYRQDTGLEAAAPPRAAPLSWIEFPDGVYRIGHDGEGFAYDNEGPRHRVYLEPFSLAARPVTNGEYLEFMQDGGYGRAELWLSLGWATVQEQGWSEPFYWEQRDGAWWHYTLQGMRRVDEAEPVCHLSYFEADAFARWAGARLPTEAEWEVAAAGLPVNGNFADGPLRPLAAKAREAGLQQMFGDVWEWTQSQYTPYPGYRPPEGALGEYNGKFMCNQFVLRGGSCVTPPGHIRPTYRNFFPPEATWQFSGLRLAKDA